MNCVLVFGDAASEIQRIRGLDLLHLIADFDYGLIWIYSHHLWLPGGMAI